MNTLLKSSYLAVAVLPGLLFAYQEFIRDNTIDINHVLYGDITKMDDMFINPSDYEGSDDNHNFQNVNRDRQYIDQMASLTNELKSIEFETFSNSLNKTRFEINDFNKISRSLNNVTRRYERVYYDDPEDYYAYIEPYKKQELINVGLQFLIHSRYKLISAFKQREAVMSSKPYRLGYLFNKLRRILYDLAKIKDQGVKKGYYLETDDVLRLYEQAVRLHIDGKDLIGFVKLIDSEPDEEPIEITTTKLPRNERVASTPKSLSNSQSPVNI